jgi:hypothetical protein
LSEHSNYQIIKVGELLEGKKILRLPVTGSNVTSKKHPSRRQRHKVKLNWGFKKMLEGKNEIRK